MAYTIQEILEYIKENDVQFIKLFFTDVFGLTKSISIQPGEVEKAFNEGIEFDASSELGFFNYCESDLLVRPDPATLSILPWRPQHGRVVRFYCNIFNIDGSPFEGDSRAWLKKVQDHAISSNLKCLCSTECEFYLFKLDASGLPTLNPYDDAGYCDLAPRDKGENVRRSICTTLEQMGITPKTSRHETGPGQNVVDFNAAQLMTAADNLITFKNVVSTIAFQNGLFASFFPKPLKDSAGNGLHISLCLEDSNKEIQKYFAAGILNRIKEITAFLNPLESSYKRLGDWDAPKYISWSKQNRNQLLRVVDSKKNTALRLELRSPDPWCNPYTALSLVVLSGIEGIEHKTPLQSSCDVDLSHASLAVKSQFQALPNNIDEALELASGSDFVCDIIPKSALQTLLAVRAIQN